MRTDAPRLQGQIDSQEHKSTCTNANSEAEGETESNHPDNSPNDATLSDYYQSNPGADTNNTGKDTDNTVGSKNGYHSSSSERVFGWAASLSSLVASCVCLSSLFLAFFLSASFFPFGFAN